jgi:DNA (cytosine-5)-methyltransferase 1
MPRKMLVADLLCGAGAQKCKWPEPFLVILRNHMDGQDLDRPIPAIAANGQHIGLVEPIILSQHNSGAPRGVSEPLPTITTGGAAAANHPGCARPMLVEPFILSRQGEGAARPVSEPTPTQTAKHSHVLISPYYGSGSGKTCTSAENPLPTVTAKARFGIVIPITHADGTNRYRDVNTDPLPTVTTAHRGEQALVEGTCEYDILFRMLEPHELAAAMGFTEEGQSYEFAGTKTDQIKQIGNAVSVSMMKAEVKAIMADAAPKAAALSESKRRAIA